jgi:di/tricarboxylate transporter
MKKLIYPGVTMTTRNLLTSIVLIVGFMIATFALATARPTMTESAVPESAAVMQPRSRGRMIPAPTPSPGARRPKPIQSPKPKR